MDYEKKYKEALERAKEWMAGKYSHYVSDNPQEISEFIFPELKESRDEKIRKEIIKLVKFLYGSSLACEHTVSKDKMLAWLEKQGQSKKTSIWKHWKDGIAGNGDGIPAFLIKNGLTYSLSPCLSFECDYIELSELDSLMLEKQSEPKDYNSIDPHFGKPIDKVEQEQSIEIPFGAKDSELQEATYHIPEGYHAEINGNEVVIKKGE